MEGICTGTREGTPLIGEGEGEGEVRLAHPTQWSGPLPLFSPVMANVEATKSTTQPLRHTNQAQHPVAGSTQNPFKLCNFPLVTLPRLLY